MAAAAFADAETGDHGHSHGDGKPAATAPSMWASLSSTAAAVWRAPDGRRIAVFATALAALAAVQAAYAVTADSLGLLSDACHTAFHAASLAIAAGGMVMARAPPTFEFSYGFDRYEVLAAFANAMFLIFVALFVVAGAAQRLLLPSGDGGLVPTTLASLEFGAVGLALNVAGMVWLGPTQASVWSQLSRYAQGAGLAMPFAGTFAAVGNSNGGSGAAAEKGGAPASAALRSQSFAALYAHALLDGASSVAVILAGLLMRWTIAPAIDAFQVRTFALLAHALGPILARC